MSNVTIIPAEKAEPSKCSYGGCQESAIWTRKPGWTVAPGSPPGDVCERHHCWTRIEGIR